MQRVPDGTEHTVALGMQFCIPYAQDSVSLSFKPLLPDGVTRILGVLATVEFDDQIGCWTEEIDDVVTYGHLPPKLEIDETAIAEDAPERLLSFGRDMTH